MKKILLTGLLLIGVSTLTAKEYIVDKVHSTIEFKVRHMMIGHVRGDFDDFSGKYNYNPKTKKLSSLEGEVKIASINTKDAQRDKHLRSSAFFDAKRYPKMYLKLVKVVDSTAIINLTIKGVTRKINFQLEDLSGESIDPWKNIRTGFSMNARISRKAYGILFHKLLETGGVAVGDEIKISIELEGTTKEHS